MIANKHLDVESVNTTDSGARAKFYLVTFQADQSTKIMKECYTVDELRDYLTLITKAGKHGE